MTPEDEARVATFFATPAYREIRHLIEQIAPGSTAPIDELTSRVRRDLWRDLSAPDI